MQSLEQFIDYPLVLQRCQERAGSAYTQEDVRHKVTLQSMVHATCFVKNAIRTSAHGFVK